MNKRKIKEALKQQKKGSIEYLQSEAAIGFALADYRALTRDKSYQKRVQLLDSDLHNVIERREVQHEQPMHTEEFDGVEESKATYRQTDWLDESQINELSHKLIDFKSASSL